MTRWVALLAIAVTAACGSLADTGNGVVGLQIFAPDSLFLYRDSSLTLRAVALNLHGDPVATADIVWRTPDTALIAVDSVHGVVTAKLDTTATARVQASVGTLLSDPIIITLRPDSTTSAGLRGRP